MLCPKCKSYCPNDAEECDCGYNFLVGKMRSTANPEDRSTLQKAADPEALHSYMENEQRYHSGLKGAFIVLYIIGGLNLVLGMILVLVPSLGPVIGAVGIVSCILGAFAVITGILVQRRAAPAYVALIIYTAIYGLDTLIGAVSLLSSCRAGSFLGLGLRILFLVLLIRGCITLWEIREERKRIKSLQQTVSR